MIISALMTLLLGIFSILLSPLALITLPSSVTSVFTQILSYLLQGFQVIAAYTHFSYLFVLFGFVVVFDTLLFFYKIVMWILRKIPFLNIK